MELLKVVRKVGDTFLSLCPSRFELTYQIGETTKADVGPIFCYIDPTKAIGHCEFLRESTAVNDFTELTTFYVLEGLAEIDHDVVVPDEKIAFFGSPTLTSQMIRDFWWDKEKREEMIKNRGSSFSVSHTLFDPWAKHHVALCKSFTPQRIVF